MLTPVVKFMQRISYPSRFAIIGVIFLISLAYMVYGLYRTSQDSIDFSAKEKLGVAYLIPLTQTLNNTVQLQYLTAQAALGNLTAKAALPGAQAQFQQQWAKLIATHSQYGSLLRTDSAWKSLTNAKDALSHSVTNPSQMVSTFNALTNQITSLISIVSDSSNLTLDPDIDTFYLMDSATTKLPVLISYMGEALSITSQLQSEGHPLSADMRDRLIEIRPLIAENMSGLSSNIVKAIAYNSALKADFNRAFDELTSYSKAHNAFIARALSGHNDLTGMHLSEQNIEINRQLNQLALQHLDVLLDIRMNHIKNQRNLYLGVALVAILLTFFLFHQLYLSITLQLGGEPFYVQYVVGQLSLGKLNIEVKLREHDNNSLLYAIYQMRNQLRDTVKELLNTAHEITRASKEIADTSSQLSERSAAQSEAAASMAAAVEELSTSLAVSAEQSSQVNQLTHTAVERSTDGQRVINSLDQSMESVVQDVSRISETIGSLSQQSESIVSIVDVIRDVADQTNLLALNAAIEAARAGEQGRGFAVVADEVRKLAERTALSTTEISNIVSGIKNTSNKAADSMKAGMGTIHSGQAHTHQAGSSISRIQECINQVLDSINQISLALKEQSRTSLTLTQNVEHVAQMSEENANAVKQSAYTASKLQNVAQQLSQLANRFTV